MPACVSECAVYPRGRAGLGAGGTKDAAASGLFVK